MPPNSVMPMCTALRSGAMKAPPPLYFSEAAQFYESLRHASLTLQQARYEAHHDPLTGLANRALFSHFLDQQLAMSRQTAAQIVLLYIDLDGFKAVNDGLGHAVGDQLLKVAAERIRAACRASDVAARLGGDEFVVALIDTDMDSACAFAARLIDKLSAAYQCGQASITSVSASVGLAASGSELETAQSLINLADAAMYRAKALGKRRYDCAR